MRIFPLLVVNAIALALAGCGGAQSQVAASSGANPAAPVPLESSDEIRERIAQAVARVDGRMQIVGMRPSPRADWHEIHFLDAAGRDQFAYASNDGETLLIGEMIDMEAGVSVSLLSALGVRDLLLQNEAGGGRVINWAAPSPTQTLYAFTDPTCGACSDLHAAIPELNAAGISVTYLAYPAGEKGSESFEASAAAWCRADRKEGFAQAMKGGLTGASDECVATVEHHQRLARRLGLNSAPSLISSAGLHLDSFPGAAALIAQLTPPPATEGSVER